MIRYEPLPGHQWDLRYPSFQHSGSRTKGKPTARTRPFANHYETFFLARKGKPQLLKPGRSNVFVHDGVYGNARFHPTQKPIPLLAELLEAVCPNNGMVLVPFLGSGSTLLAAFQSNRAGIGWDLDERNRNYFYASVASIEKKGTPRAEVVVKFGKPQKDDDGTTLPVLVGDDEIGVLYCVPPGPWQPDEELVERTGEFSVTSLQDARKLIAAKLQ